MGTREATAVLFLESGGNDVEVARYSWDSTRAEPGGVRIEVGQSFSKVKAVVHVDDVVVTERTM